LIPFQYGAKKDSWDEERLDKKEKPFFQGFQEIEIALLLIPGHHCQDSGGRGELYCEPAEELSEFFEIMQLRSYPVVEIRSMLYIN